MKRKLYKLYRNGVRKVVGHNEQYVDVKGCCDLCTDIGTCDHERECNILS